MTADPLLIVLPRAKSNSSPFVWKLKFWHLHHKVRHWN